MTADREQAFNDACRLVKAWGSSPWRDWLFTLRLADWLLGDQEAPTEPPGYVLSVDEFRGALDALEDMHDQARAEPSLAAYAGNDPRAVVEVSYQALWNAVSRLTPAAPQVAPTEPTAVDVEPLRRIIERARGVQVTHPWTDADYAVQALIAEATALCDTLAAPQVAPEPDDEWVHDLPALGEDD